MQLMAVLAVASSLAGPAEPFKLPALELSVGRPAPRKTAFALNAADACPPGFDCSPVRPSLRASAERTVASLATGDHQVGAVKGFEPVDVQKPKKEKFFGPVNILLGVGLLGSGVADVETTYTCMGTRGYSETLLPNGSVYQETRWCEEGNAHFRPFVERGRWAAHGAKAGLNGAIWVGTHFMRRSRHVPLKVAGWVLPVFAIGYQSKFAVSNVRTTEWVRHGGPR